MSSPRFVTTRWSIVLAAGGAANPSARAALESLCATYWYPLYAFARRRGLDTEKAQDAVQEFFADLLARESLAAADPSRGRFRSFLLTAFKNHLANQRARDSAQKRGGDRLHLSLDIEQGERRFSLEPSHDETPERLFLRGWALTLLRDVLAGLRAGYAERGKEELFDGLKEYLTAGAATQTYAAKALALDMREGAVKVAVHRLRSRYGSALQQALADTVEGDGEGELRDLLMAVEPVK